MGFGDAVWVEEKGAKKERGEAEEDGFGALSFVEVSVRDEEVMDGEGAEPEGEIGAGDVGPAPGLGEDLLGVVLHAPSIFAHIFGVSADGSVRRADEEKAVTAGGEADPEVAIFGAFEGGIEEEIWGERVTAEDDGGGEGLIAEAEVADGEFAGMGGVVVGGGGDLAEGIDADGAGGDGAEFVWESQKLMENGFEEIWMPEVIGIEEGDEGEFGVADTGISGGRKAGVGLGEVAEAGVGEGVDDGGGLIGGAVIDDEEFEERVRLLEDGGDGFWEVVGVVKRGDDDGDGEGGCGGGWGWGQGDAEGFHAMERRRLGIFEGMLVVVVVGVVVILVVIGAGVEIDPIEDEAVEIGVICGEHIDGGLGASGGGIAAPDDEDHAIDDVLHDGGFGEAEDWRGIDDDAIEAGAEGLDEVAKGGGAEEFGATFEVATGGHDAEVWLIGGAAGFFEGDFAEEEIAEAGAFVEAEEAMESTAAEIGIDEEGFVAGMSEGDGEVRRDDRFAFFGHGTGDHGDLGGLGGLAHGEEIGANDAKIFDEGVFAIFVVGDQGIGVELGAIDLGDDAEGAEVESGFYFVEVADGMVEVFDEERNSECEDNADEERD